MYGIYLDFLEAGFGEDFLLVSHLLLYIESSDPDSLTADSVSTVLINLTHAGIQKPFEDP